MTLSDLAAPGLVARLVTGDTPDRTRQGPAPVAVDRCGAREAPCRVPPGVAGGRRGPVPVAVDRDGAKDPVPLITRRLAVSLWTGPLRRAGARGWPARPT